MILALAHNRRKQKDEMSRNSRGNPFTGPRTPILMHWPQGGGIKGRVTGKRSDEIFGQVGVGQPKPWSSGVARGSCG